MIAGTRWVNANGAVVEVDSVDAKGAVYYGRPGSSTSCFSMSLPSFLLAYWPHFEALTPAPTLGPTN